MTAVPMVLVASCPRGAVDEGLEAQGGRLEAILQAIAGWLLLLYVPWAWILSGFGIGPGDVAAVFLSPLFVAALLAVPPARRLWLRGDRRVVLGVVALAGASALLHLLRAILDPVGCPPSCQAMPAWVTPAFLLYHWAGRIGLALPLVAALDLRSRAFQAVALGLFLTGTAALPFGLDLSRTLGGGIAEWWLALLALLVLLALCLVWSASLLWFQAARDP